MCLFVCSSLVSCLLFSPLHSFHPSRSLLASVSDDWTLRVFSTRMERDKRKKKGNGLKNSECLWCCRGHNGPVLSLEVNAQNERIYSASIDGTVMAWSIPDALEDGIVVISPSSSSISASFCSPSLCRWREICHATAQAVSVHIKTLFGVCE